MALPSSDTPLYNHPLPDIEAWLTNLGCQQNTKEINRWYIDKSSWQADIYLDIEEIVVIYLHANPNGEDIKRIFKYSLSREDVEAAIFSGP